MIFLLDVNVLVALIDPAHVQHDTWARVVREAWEKGVWAPAR